MARLFIAVWPPEEVVAELSCLHGEDQPGVRFVRPEHLHITLRFLGEADPGAVVAAFAGTTFGPARARLGPAVDILAGRVIVAPVAGLDALAEAVTELSRHIGEPPREQFVGHLTLARLKPDAAMPRVVGTLVSAEFEVEEIALVQSRPDRRGVRYETIETWSLA